MNAIKMLNNKTTTGENAVSSHITPLFRPIFFFIYPIGNVLQIIQTHLVIVAGFLGLGGGGGTYTLLLVV